MCSDHHRGEIAIRVCDAGKCYQIYNRPQDRLKQAALRWLGRRYYREFWALRHLNLEVSRGETVGIIGRNGSGKSTLLQIIAGTLRPSEGGMETRGRVAALLELGSGFNAEFTGRENVYVNGAILGLPTSEIDRRFDEITAFAEIGDFIDQPIKTYSTGMVVRLAFAVLAMLSPDILVIDEALAVGDEGFQRKCYAWLERFRQRGGTTLFVTHSAQLVVQLCDRAVLLDGGELLAEGDSKPVVDAYQKLLYGTPAEARILRAELRRSAGDVAAACAALADLAAPSAPQQDSLSSEAYYDDHMISPPEVSYGTGEAEILDVAMLDERGRRANVFVCGQASTWTYRVRFDRAACDTRFGMMIKTIEGVDVVGVSSSHFRESAGNIGAGETLEVRFDMRLNLAPGTYFLNSGVSSIQDGEERYLHRRVDVAAIRIISPDQQPAYGLAYVEPAISIRRLKTGAELEV